MTSPTPQPVPLGQSGIAVSPIAWGMWRFGGEVARARTLIETALECGITLFDTADIYGLGGDGFGSAEALLGRVLAEAPHLRDRMVLASKGGIIPGLPYDSSADYLTRALDASLGRLGVDRIDLWQVHRPDLRTHPAALAATLTQMVESGKVRAIGVSNFTPAQTRALQAHLSFPLASTQPQFSALHNDPLWNGELDLAMEKGLAVLAWSPLGGGRLDPESPVGAALGRKAKETGVSLAAAALAWVMAHPARPIPIVGSQRPERIRDALGALGVVWSRSEWYAVLEAAIGAKLP
jgi:aryl-alcohol dehydrogenase-like predicted oxidoreductase